MKLVLIWRTFLFALFAGYVQNFEMATKKHEKIVGPPPIELPPDFVSYDGTNDIKWNAKYAELVKVRMQPCATGCCDDAFQDVSVTSSSVSTGIFP